MLYIDKIVVFKYDVKLNYIWNQSLKGFELWLAAIPVPSSVSNCSFFYYSISEVGAPVSYLGLFFFIKGSFCDYVTLFSAKQAFFFTLQ